MSRAEKVSALQDIKHEVVWQLIETQVMSKERHKGDDFVHTGDDDT